MSNVKRRALIFSAATSVAGLCSLSPNVASGAVATWSTAPATSFWNNAANWLSGGASYLPQANDALVFAAAGNGITSLNNNFTAGTAFTGITFAAGSAAYTFSGNGIVLNGAAVGTLLVENNFQGFALNGITNSATTLQTINLPVTIDVGPHTFSGGTGGIALNPTGGLTRNIGAVATFNPGAGNITTTTIANTNGILGGWATVGNDWATRNASNQIVALSAGSYTNVAGGASIATAAASNVKITPAGGNVTMAAAGVTDINTLLYSDATAQTVDIAAGRTLRLGALGGIFRTGTTNTTLTIGTGANVGILTAGGADNTAGEIVVNAGGGGNTNNNITINSQITDNGTGAVRLIKMGQAATSLGGSNTYSGGTYIVDGRLGIGATANAGTGPIYVVGQGQAFLGADTYSQNFFIGGTGTGESNGNGAIRIEGATLNGVITLIGNARIDKRTGTGQVGTINGQITGGFNLEIGGNNNANTDPVVVLTNTTNNWTGNTLVDAAVTLRLGGNEVIPNGAGFGNVSLNASNSGRQPTLDLNGFGETINGLSSGGAGGTTRLITNNAANTTSTITVGDNNQTSTFAGQINNGNGIVSLTKTGSGVLTLSGTSNYSGATTINNGTLLLSATGSLSGATSIVVGAGGNLNISALSGITVAGSQSIANSGTITGNVNVSTGALTNNAGGVISGNIAITGNNARLAGNFNTKTISTSGGTMNPGVSGTGNVSIGTLTNDGAILFEIGGAASDTVNVVNSFSGGNLAFSVLSAPTQPFYDIITYGSLGAAPTITTPTVGRASFTLAGSPPANTIRVNVTGGPAPLVWDNSVGLGDGQTWDTQGQKNWTSSTTFGDPNQFYTLDTVTFDDTNPNSNPNHYNVNITGTVTPGSVTMNNSAGSYTLSAGNIGGVGTFSKSGSGALTITTDNTFSGGLTLNAGTLNINHDHAIGTGTFTVNGGTLDSSNGDRTLTNNNPIVVGADLQFIGSNNLSTGSGSVTLNANPNINVQAKTLTIAGRIVNGTGNSITKSGNGTLVLSGTSSYSGNTTINGGTVIVMASNALGAIPGGSVSIASGAVLDIGVATAGALNFGQKEFHISGDGIMPSGGTFSGAITANTNNQGNAFQRVVLEADASIGGNARIDFRPGQIGGVNQGLLDLQGHTLTKYGTNFLAINNTDVTDGNIVVASGAGTLQFEGGTNVASLSGTKSITMPGNSTLLFQNYAGTLTRQMNFTGDVTVGNNTNNAAVVGSNISLGGNLTVTQFNTNGTGSVSLNGNITETGGSRSITKNINGTGNSMLVLAGSNNFTGGLTVNGGTVALGSVNALNPTTPQNVTLNNTSGLRLAGNSVTVGDLQTNSNAAVENNSATPATITITGSSDRTYDHVFRDGGSGALSVTKSANNNTYTFNGSNNYSGATTINGGTIQLGNGGTSGSLASASNVTGTSSGTFSVNRNDSVSIGNNIGGAVNFVKTNSNTVTYTGAHTSTGSTLVNGGALIVNGSLATTSAVSLSGGTLAGNGDGVTTGIVGNLTLDGGSSLRPGASPANNNVGTLKANSLTNNGGDLHFDIGGATGDRVNITNTLTFNGGGISLNLTQPVPQLLSYVLMQAGSISGTPTLTTTDVGRTHFSIDAGSLASNFIKVNLTGVPNHLIWRGDNAGGAIWENAQSIKNWTNSDQPALTPDYFYDLDFVTFSDTSTNRAVTVNGTLSPTSVAFSHSTGSYTLSGGGGIGGAASLVISGGGRVNMNVNNSYTGTTAIQNGTLVLGSSTALPSSTALVLGNSTTSGAVDLNGNSVTVGSASTSGTGTSNGITNGGTSDATLTISSSSLAFSGSISDGATNKTALTLNAGSLALTANNTYTGQTTISNGATLQLGDGGNTGSFGGGHVQNDGTFAVNRTGTIVITDNFTGGGATNIIAGTVQVGAGTTTGALTGGAITDNGTLVFNRSDDLSVGTVISGTGNVVKSGSGSFTFTGANAYSGTTFVNSGTMSVGATGNLGTSSVVINSGGAFDTKAVILSAHAFTIAGSGVSGSGAMFNSGAGQTSTISSLTLSDNATIKADSFGAGTTSTNGRWDIRNGTALLDLAGHTLTKIGDAQFSVVAGTITSGTIEVNAGNFAIQTTTIAHGTGQINVNSSAPSGTTMLTFWNNAAGNITMPIRFNGDGNIIGNAASGAASLAVVSSPITLNGNLIISNAIPNNTTTAPITLAGPIGETTSHSLTKVGPITATLSGSNSYSGGTNVNEGTLITTTNFSNGTLTVGTASNAAFAQVTAKGTAASPTGLTFIPALSIQSNGTLDLTNNAMAIDYPSGGPTPFTDIRNLIVSGRNNGTWDGAGIQSSTAKAVAADGTNTHKTALGFGEASAIGISSFNGHGVDGTAVLVRYTWTGDANLDGNVNGLDFNALVTNFGTSTTLWTNADFNFDGQVNMLDFDAVAVNFNQSQGTPGPVVEGATALGSLVPEPGSAALLLAGAMTLARRRRR